MVKTARGELAVEFEVLSDHYSKLKRTFDRCFATLAIADAAGESPATQDLPAQPWLKDRAKWAKRSPRLRLEQRRIFGDRWLERRLARVGPGWRKQTTPDFLVLSRADRKFTKRIVQAAIAARSWVENRFIGISDEIVMPAALIIFADKREATAYRMREVNARQFHPGRREIYFYADKKAGNIGGEFGPLIRGVLEHYVYDKDPAILDNLPRWLDSGLREYTDSSRLRGKKLTLAPNELEYDTFRVHQKKRDWPTPRELILEEIAQAPEEGMPETPWTWDHASARLIRWLEAGGGTALGHPDFLISYLQSIGKVARQAPPDPAKDVDWRLLKPDEAKLLWDLVHARRTAFHKLIQLDVVPLTDAKWQIAYRAFIAFNEKFKRYTVGLRVRGPRVPHRSPKGATQKLLATRLQRLGGAPPHTRHHPTDLRSIIATPRERQHSDQALPEVEAAHEVAWPHALAFVLAPIGTHKVQRGFRIH